VLVFPQKHSRHGAIEILSCQFVAFSNSFAMMQIMEAFLEQNIWVLVVLSLWVLPWKGYALWLSARNSHKKWFIVLLVVNTLAILDIIYIFLVGRKAAKQI